jgi:arsenate reductase-like glutaredoxin family protein
MSEISNHELQHWMARCDDMQVANERLREERDELRERLDQSTFRVEALLKELEEQRSIITRIQIAMSQGQEL